MIHTDKVLISVFSLPGMSCFLSAAAEEGGKSTLLFGHYDISETLSALSKDVLKNKDSTVFSDFLLKETADDFHSSLAAYKKTAESGDVKAQLEPGVIYTYAYVKESHPDYVAEAVKWLQRASDQGSAEAQLQIST